MFYTYVLYSKGYDKIYIGYTSDLQKRIEEHNAGKSRFTKSYKPWGLVYSEKFLTRSLSMKREKELKSHQGRDFIRKNILPGRVRQLPD